LRRALLVLLVLVFASTSVANAWDGQRKGFLLGIGFGAGFDSYSKIQYDPISPVKEDNSQFAFAASPRIGYAINNQLAIYYSRHPLLFSVKTAENKDLALTSCIEAISMQYYFSDKAPSVYVGGGAGVGYFFDSKKSNYSVHALKGIGLFGTVGYEPRKHILSEFSLHYKSPQSGSSDIGVTLLVSVLGY
jgi:hypothetical protein